MGTPDTPFVETEVLIAVIDGQLHRAVSTLRTMTDTELRELADAADRVSHLARELLARRQPAGSPHAQR
jgi:hypothetical protein